MRYLHRIPAFLSGAAVRLRERRNGLRHAAVGAVALLRAHVRRFSHSAVGAVARGCGHLEHVSHALAGMAARIRSELDRRRRRAADRWRARAPVESVAPATRLAPGRQWEIVIGLAERELARVPAIAALQARAAVKIDAAEHALGRIVADCAKVLAGPAVPTPQTARRLAPRPEAPARRPLAA